MNTAPESGFDATFQDIYRAVVRHRGKALLVFSTSMIVASLVTFLSPRTYKSESKLFVRLGRENATLDPTVTLGGDPVVVVPYAREDEMNSVAAMLASRAMLERVVDRVGPDVVLHGKGSAAPAFTSEETPSAGLPAASDDAPQANATLASSALGRALFQNGVPVRERALRHLSGRLKVVPVRKSNIVEVAYEAPTPELSQHVVATLVDAYLEEHARLNRVPGSHRFFAEQAARLASELQEFETQLVDLKMQTGLASIEDQRSQIIVRLGRLSDELLEAESDRAEAEAKVRALRGRLAALPSSRVSETVEGISDPGTDGIRQQFFALQLREKQAAAIYTDLHPKLQAIREELALAQEVHDRNERTRAHVTTAPDSIYEQTRLALAEEEPVLESLTARAAALERQLGAVQAELDVLTAAEVQLAKLRREIELREADYRRYAVNLEQARIDDALESQRMSNISLVQPASYEARPVRPRAVLNLAMGMLIGLCGAFGTALFAEHADHSFRTPEDVERRLEIPALVAIPRVSREALRTNGRPDL